MSESGDAGTELMDRVGLAGTVARLGREIAADFPDGVVLVGLLKGSACLIADLARALRAPCSVDFLALSSYGGGGSRVKVAKDLDVDVADRDVVVVMDLVDTGLTLAYVLRLLGERGARSAECCALLDRRVRRLIPVPIRYVGRVIGDEYVVGYGLDLDERFRNLSDLVVIDPGRARALPDAMLDRLARR